MISNTNQPFYSHSSGPSTSDSVSKSNSGPSSCIICNINQLHHSHSSGPSMSDSVPKTNSGPVSCMYNTGISNTLTYTTTYKKIITKIRSKMPRTSSNTTATSHIAVKRHMGRYQVYNEDNLPISSLQLQCGIERFNSKSMSFHTGQIYCHTCNKYSLWRF